MIYPKEYGQGKYNGHSALCTSPWYVIYYTAVIDPKECGEEQKVESGKRSKYNGHSCIMHISLVCYILYSCD